MKRIVTALVLLPIVVWVVLASPGWVFDAVLIIIGLFAFHEFDQIAASQGIGRAGIPGMAAGIALLFAPNPEVTVVLVALVAMTLALRANDLKKVFPSAGAFLLGVVYIFGAWRCARGLRDINPHWLMVALL